METFMDVETIKKVFSVLIKKILINITINKKKNKIIKKLGQLALGDLKDRYEFVKINIPDVVNVTVGGYHTIFQKSNYFQIK